MKAHVFISVLVFHFVVIAGLYLLSACSSSSNTTVSSQRSSAPSTGGSIYDQYEPPNRPTEDESLVASPVAAPPRQDRGIDPAFNSGSGAYTGDAPSGSGGDLSEPRRPGSDLGLQTGAGLNEFREDEVLQPVLNTPSVSPDVEYVVKPGDSLWKISREFGVSLNTLLEANGLTKDSTIQVGQVVAVPSSDSAPASAVPGSRPEPSSTGAPSTGTYTVVRGDTLSRIAKQFNTTVDAIQLANGLPTHIIQVGQQLTIPANSGLSGAPTTPPATAATPRTAPSTPPASSTSSTVQGDIVHIVEAGETPSGIARQYGITTAQLMRDNAITDPRKIVVGQELQILLSPAQPATPPPASTRSTIPPPTREPVSTPTTFDESVFDDLEGIPEVEVVPQE